jgi:4-amino-4-deoxy-L-arabinose transferase-like glycosyltransferase
LKALVHASATRPLRPGSLRATAGALALVGAAAALMLFLDLGRPPLLLWDESREAVHALEMSRSGDLLVPTMDGQADVAYANPPLANWLGVAGIRALGENELAVRLPSALAALAAVLIVVWFGARRLGDPAGGFLGGIILLSTPGFVGLHVARSADLDALLVLAAALGTAAVSFAAALMTRADAALVPVLALLVYAAFGRQLREVFADWRTWAAGLAALVPIALFLTLRERLTPGFFSAALGGAGRSGMVVGGHASPWTFYWNELVHNGLFFPWLLVLPLSIAPVWLDPPRRRFVGFAILAAATELAVLTLLPAKQWWYPAPIYPIAAVACGAGLSAFVRRSWSASTTDRVVAVVAATAVFLLVPVGTIRAMVGNPVDAWPFRRGESFQMEWRTHLTALQPLLPPGARLRILPGDAPAEPLFYAEAMHLVSPPALVKTPSDVEAGDYVATCNPNLLEPFEAAFTLTDVYRSVCRTVVVAGPRGPDVQP